MAKYQYRVTGELNWQSNSGNALLAISNPNGSGRKLTVRAFELTSMCTGTTSPLANTAHRDIYALARGTVAGGRLVPVTDNDTDASAWPSTVRVLTNGTITSPLVLRHVTPLGPVSGGGMGWLGRSHGMGWLRGLGLGRRKDTDLERIVVRAGESLALYHAGYVSTQSFRVTGTLVREGSPDRAYSFRYFASSPIDGDVIFGIENQSGSGETVSLADIAIESVGDLSTPYFQIVPVGASVDIENTEQPAVLKMDSDYPSHAAYMKLGLDVPILPFGLPENALADSSAGSPKGFNYLKTKDFLGPVYRTLFPEQVGVSSIATGALDALNRMTPQFCDPFMRKAGITVRPGEGIALVSGAETATAAYIGVSGWNTFHVSAVVDIEPETIPDITITGMVEDSRWRVERVSDSSLVATGVADGTGTATFSYTAEDLPLDLRLRVRKASSAPLYKAVELQFTMGFASTSIPVSQVSDD